MSVFVFSPYEVSVIFVNIFGGIARCDTIALGLIMAVARIQGKQKPVVVRLEGTKMAQAKKLVEVFPLFFCFVLKQIISRFFQQKKKNWNV